MINPKSALFLQKSHLYFNSHTTFGIDPKLSTCDDNEHASSLGHTRVFKKGDLALYDRNYASFWLFSLLLNKKVGSWKVVKELSNSPAKEVIREIHPSKASAKKCKELGISSRSIKLRFIWIELNTGEKEILIISLIDKKISLSNIL